MKKKLPYRLFTAIAIVCLSILWIREFTLRKAIQEADHYMMPFIVSGNLFRTSYRFTLLEVIHDSAKVRFNPGWNVGYEPVDVLANGLGVHVPLFRKASGTTHWELTHALNLPFGEERKQAIEKLLNE